MRRKPFRNFDAATIKQTDLRRMNIAATNIPPAESITDDNFDDNGAVVTRIRNLSRTEI